MAQCTRKGYGTSCVAFVYFSFVLKEFGRESRDNFTRLLMNFSGTNEVGPTCILSMNGWYTLTQVCKSSLHSFLGYYSNDDKSNNCNVSNNDRF